MAGSCSCRSASPPRRAPFPDVCGGAETGLMLWRRLYAWNCFLFQNRSDRVLVPSANGSVVEFKDEERSGWKQKRRLKWEGAQSPETSLFYLRERLSISSLIKGTKTPFLFDLHHFCVFNLHLCRRINSDQGLSELGNWTNWLTSSGSLSFNTTPVSIVFICVIFQNSGGREAATPPTSPSLSSAARFSHSLNPPTLTFVCFDCLYILVHFSFPLVIGFQEYFWCFCTRT